MRPIAIAGAGIGGLVAAIALARRGIEVVVFEAAEILAEAGAGLQLSPNACRVLRHLDLLDAVRADAVAPEALTMRGHDGALLARLPFGAWAERRFGAPLLVTHRADLQRVLLDVALRLPQITLGLGATVERWRPQGDGLAVTLAGRDASVAVAGLVGADGVHSAVGRRLGKGPAVFSGRVAWRALIDSQTAPAAALRPETNLWLGPKAHLVHYPLRGGRLVNVVAIVNDAAPGAFAGSGGFWSRRGEAERLRHRFARWAAPARAILAAAPEWRVWPLLDRPADAAWSSGPVTLLGDAAHPMLPFLAQGAAQAIEDAAALAEAVAAEPGAIAAAFARYEGRRRPRTARVQNESRRQAMVYHLPRPGATLRDLVLRNLGPERLLARYDWLYGSGT